MEFIILWSADSDAIEACAYYEEESAGLGHDFIMCLEEVFSRIKQFPAMAPIFYNEFCKMKVLRYPFAVFYRVYLTRIVVAAILDLRQDPERIRARLDPAL